MHTLNYITEDAGDPECIARKRFEVYIRSLWHIGVKVATNLKVYSFLCDEKSENLYLVSPVFFRISQINSYSECVISLCEVFSQNCDSLNLESFYNYAEQNQKFLFNKRFFEEKIGVPDSREEVLMPNFQTQKDKYKEDISTKQELIAELKNDRDKIFAHFDKKYYVGDGRIETLNISELQSLLDTFSASCNNLCAIYDRIHRCFDLVSAYDIRHTMNAVDYFMKYNKEIFAMERSKKV